MTQPILVTYATRAGATAGVATAIAKTLAERGLAVEVYPMQEVHDISPYRAVVAGSAIQEGQWLPEAIHFIEYNRAALKQKPFAAFLVCMTLAMKNPAMRNEAFVSNWLEPVRQLVKPVSEGLFAGALHLNKVPSLSQRFKFWISCRLGVWSEGDHRDWNAITAWAATLPEKL